MKYYNTPYNCPAFNFYKADEDINHLLIEPLDISVEQEVVLMNAHLDLKEWFSLNYSKNNYSSLLQKNQKKMALENKLTSYNAIRATISAIGDVLVSDALNDDNLTNLKTICKEIKLPFNNIAKDMVSTIDRYIKGATNDYNRLTQDLKEKATEFNYIRECLKVSRALGMQVEPMKISLAEWLELIKMAESDGRS